MLKKIPVALKIAIGIVLVVSTIVFVTYEDQHATDKYQRICQEQVHRVSPGAGEKDTANAKECEDPKDYMPWWYKLVAWPEGIGGWALIATGFVISWQSYETRRAAQATEGTLVEAKASRTLAEKTAKQQLRAYISLDSAEVVFQNGQPIAIVNFKNRGQTPAYEAYGWAGVESAPHPLQIVLPTPKNIAKPKHTVGPEGGFGFPGQRKSHPFSEAELASFEHEKRALYVYGRVDYKDTFGDSWYTNFRLIAGGQAGLRKSTSPDGKIRWILGPDLEGNDAT